MLPRPTGKYVGYGPISLARMSHEAEDAENDVELLAIMDAVSTMSEIEQSAFRRAYIDMHKPSR